ncbi:hypothetical protein ID866_10664 [Astraeus odoratus]|nr:hypothetical protein ID866_10664 [Astraeus odoratus]
MAWRVSGWSIVMALTMWSMTAANIGNPYLDHTLGVWVFGTLILDSVRMLLLTQPLREFHHISDKVPAHQLPFLRRFFWIMGTTGRGIGWSFEDKHCIRPVDVRHRTRASFVASRLRGIIVLYIVLDITHIYSLCNPVFLSGAPIAEQGYFVKCINFLVYFFTGYASLTIVYDIMAVVAVATNLYQPTLWPSPFGHVKDAYTIRRYWGRVWHQFTRYQLTIFGPHRWRKQHAVHATPPSGSSTHAQNDREPWARSYRRICNAFLCSAFMHTCGDVILQIKIWRNASSAGIDTLALETRIPNVIGFSAPFYLLQPVGILVEDAAMAIGRRLGLKAGTWSYKDANRAAYPALYEGSGRATAMTTVEKITKRYFGVDLAPPLSSWLAG